MDLCPSLSQILLNKSMFWINHCKRFIVNIYSCLLDLFHKSFKPLCFPPSQGGLRGGMKEVYCASYLLSMLECYRADDSIAKKSCRTSAACVSNAAAYCKLFCLSCGIDKPTWRISPVCPISHFSKSNWQISI